MRGKSKHLFITFAVGLGLTLVLLWLVGHTQPAHADPDTRYVAPTGSDTGDCTNSSSPCRTVQYAVDQAAEGDEILVATGVYTGVQARPAPSGYNNPPAGDVITQVLYVSKAVTIQGGYTNTNWLTLDPEANPTTLDAQGQGRGLVIAGTISPTVEGLRITGGDATGLGGNFWGDDAGGGMYVYEATATISNCVVYSNTASTATAGWGAGGGLCLWDSDATLSGNTVQGNTASTASLGAGGGLFLWNNDATLSGNTVQGNTASTGVWGDGGGLFLWDSDATLSGNTVQGNTASTASGGAGGGLYLDNSDATLSGNTVQGNTASTSDQGDGGGLYLANSDATLSGNTVQGNTASTALDGYGGGLFLWDSDATLSGNTVQGNTASTSDEGDGGGLCLWDSDATLSGNTVVSNTATLNPFSTGRGGGLWVWRIGAFTLTNNMAADNHANTEGSGLWFGGVSANPTSGRMLHTTISDNRSSGQGVFVGDYTTLAFTNTIIAGHHGMGINVTTGSTVTLEATLWHDNGSDTGGGGTVISSSNVYGNPAFAKPSAWDYHLTAGSAAIDAGVNAGVTTDIDGESRPARAGYDIGADELWHKIYLPLVIRNHQP